MFTLFTPGQIVQFWPQGIPGGQRKLRGPKFEFGSMVRTTPYKIIKQISAL
jgi:hypothetical protein